MGSEKLGEKVLLNVIDKLFIGLIAALIVILFNNRNDRYIRLRNASMAIATQYSTLLAKALDQIIEDNDEYISVLEDLKINNLHLEGALPRLSGIKKKQQRLVSKIKTLVIGKEDFLDMLINEMQRINSGLQKYIPEDPANRASLVKDVENYLNELKVIYSNYLARYGEFSRCVLVQDIKKIL